MRFTSQAVPHWLSGGNLIGTAATLDLICLLARGWLIKSNLCRKSMKSFVVCGQQ